MPERIELTPSQRTSPSAFAFGFLLSVNSFAANGAVFLPVGIGHEKKISDRGRRNPAVHTDE